VGESITSIKSYAKNAFSSAPKPVTSVHDAVYSVPIEQIPSAVMSSQYTPPKQVSRPTLNVDAILSGMSANQSYINSSIQSSSAAFDASFNQFQQNNQQYWNSRSSSGASGDTRSDHYVPSGRSCPSGACSIPGE
jgi:hypothetical protein